MSKKKKRERHIYTHQKKKKIFVCGTVCWHTWNRPIKDSVGGNRGEKVCLYNWTLLPYTMPPSDPDSMHFAVGVGCSEGFKNGKLIWYPVQSITASHCTNVSSSKTTPSDLNSLMFGYTLIIAQQRQQHTYIHTYIHKAPSVHKQI